MIIGLIGKKGSGKDTAARMLQQSLMDFGIKLEKKQMAFNLKNACSLLTNKNLNEFEDNDLKDNKYSKPLILNYDDILSFLGHFGADPERSANIYEFLKDINFSYQINSNRELLQFLGTEIVRDMLGKNSHVNSAIKSIQNNNSNYIFTDLRFENEVLSLLELKKLKNVFLLGIKRNNNKNDNHSSEQEIDKLIELYADVIIDNNSSLLDLNKSISLITKKIF